MTNSMDNKLIVWTVYKSPLDYPGQYVAREFVNGYPTALHCASDAEQDVLNWVSVRYREMGNAGLPHKLMRDRSDHASVLYSFV